MDKFDTQQFSYQKTKDGKLFVFWQGKKVRTYTGRKALGILQKLAQANDAENEQLILAQVTGNFKRGNERP